MANWSRSNTSEPMSGAPAPGRALLGLAGSLLFRRLAMVLLACLSTPVAADNLLKVWKDRLFGELPTRAKVREAPREGVVVLGLDRPEHVRIERVSPERTFKAGQERYREFELQRQLEHVSVRIQVLAGPNPDGRGNSVIKPTLHVLADDGSITSTSVVEPLLLDIRPFKPTRLLACIPVENVRRFAISTPLDVRGKAYQSNARGKIKVPSGGSFFYASDEIRTQIPYAASGELIIEVSAAKAKGEGC